MSDELRQLQRLAHKSIEVYEGYAVRDVLIRLLAEAERLRAANARLREALRPFAEYADKLLTNGRNGSLILDPLHLWEHHATADDCRRARDVLKWGGETDGQG